MGTLSLEKHWANPKIDLVDPHRTKNGQNAPSCSDNEMCLSVLHLVHRKWKNRLDSTHDGSLKAWVE